MCQARKSGAAAIYNLHSRLHLCSLPPATRAGAARRSATLASLLFPGNSAPWDETLVRSARANDWLYASQLCYPTGFLDGDRATAVGRNKKLRGTGVVRVSTLLIYHYCLPMKYGADKNSTRIYIRLDFSYHGRHPPLVFQVASRRLRCGGFVFDFARYIGGLDFESCHGYFARYSVGAQATLVRGFYCLRCGCCYICGKSDCHPCFILILDVRSLC